MQNMIMHIAYKYVLFFMMLTEINRVGPMLDKEDHFPLTPANMRFFDAAEPYDLNFTTPGTPCLEGRIDNDNYAFAFNENGCMWSIWKKRPFGHLHNPGAIFEMLSHEVSKIDTNGAYQLATNWLSVLRVDVRSLNQKRPVSVKQEYRWVGVIGKDRKEKAMPLFEVRWGNWDKPAVQFEIDGRSGEIIELRQNEDGFSRAKPTLKNLNILTNISDSEFRRYTDVEKSNLIERCLVFEKR